MKQSWLKTLRRALSLLFFLGITLLLLGGAGVLHRCLGWMPKIQFLPAVMALNFGVIALLVILTLVFGRLYCSVICPLGVFQDLIARSGIVVRKDRRPYHFRKGHPWLRYGTWVLFILALVAGVHALVALLAPYSAYGRMVANLLGPLLRGFDSQPWILSSTLVAAGTLILIVALSWKGGRTWCNEICPVGTTLGFLSRFSLLRPLIDADKCKDCRACERQCKASCIDINTHSIDASRCVTCFNCLGACKFDALHYRFAYGWSGSRKTGNAATDGGRRAFLSGSLLFLGSAGTRAQKKVDGGLAAIEEKKIPNRTTSVTPPGSMSATHLADRCTACQLCIASCPNQVLRPSDTLDRFMQPESSFERGYCRPECTRCGEVCPTGAILPIDRNEKSSIQTGHAVWIRENCLPAQEGVRCGNCARHCPTGAILMVPADPDDPDSVRIPAVDTERCIGCGACEYLCPARPLPAIYVEGHSVHKNL